MIRKFNRHDLPNPQTYFSEQGLQLIGSGAWQNAICPFHEDTKPSLRVHPQSGAFACMACGAKGGDVLAFHQLKYSLRFIDACKALGAWKDSHAKH